MTTVDKVTIDVTQELIHDQIRAVAQAMADRFGIKIDKISIDWFDYIGIPSAISNISVTTSKR